MSSGSQTKELKKILLKSPVLKKAFELTPQLGLPDWYIAGGVISQTVWNYLSGFDLISHIKDIDLVYYDPDTSAKAENNYIQHGKSLFSDLPLEVEIVNQARVHTWYEKDLGKKIEPIESTKEGIAGWLTKVTCIGVTAIDSRVHVYAPYGLNDLFNLEVHPNQVRGSKEAYEEKTNRWKKVWPKLEIFPWDTN